VRFLAERPEFAGIGKATALKLWEAFGSELYAILGSGDAGRLADVLPPTQALIACDAWRHQQALADCVVFFDEHGIDRKVASRAVSFWGDGAVAKLRDNPYRLLTVCTWASVDRVARQLGLARDDRRRLVGAIEAAVYDRLDRKHTATPEARLLADVAARLRCGEDGSRLALGEALADGAVVASPSGYQPAGAAHMERFIEGRIREMSRRDGGRRDLFIGTATPAEVDACMDGALSGETGALTAGQRAAVRLAISERFAVLTGGAGVGKTTCLRAINAAARYFGHHVVQLALAGRAAQRMADATGQPARTIASWLRAATQGKAETGPHTLMIVDEASMLDLPTTYRLLFHMHRDARLLLVGDVAQLPPIGFGLVLHGLVGCMGVPQLELTEILRSREATGIPSVSRSIREGVVPPLPAYGPGTGGCSFIASSPEDVAAHVARIRRDLAREEVQVVGSVYGGPAGIDALNARFHAANAAGKPTAGRFAADDPVIWTVNDHERGLWNGSMGVVLDVAVGSLTVRLDGKMVVLDAGELGSLDLAYAVSTHKAQGSQFDTVIVPVVRSRLLDRTLLYTAVTRAVRRVVVVGSQTAFEEAVVTPPASLDRDVGLDVARA
jgi:exodeoxyribonuclease V alpha subunit